MPKHKNYNSTTYTLNIPTHVHEDLKVIADRKDVSVDEVVAAILKKEALKIEDAVRYYDK